MKTNDKIKDNRMNWKVLMNKMNEHGPGGRYLGFKSGPLIYLNCPCFTFLFSKMRITVTFNSHDLL